MRAILDWQQWFQRKFWKRYLWQKAALKQLKAVEQICVITHGKTDTILSIYQHVKQVNRKEN